MKIKTLYWDMDGVLADMHGYFKSLCGHLPTEVGAKEFWRIVTTSDQEKPFFESLERMPDVFQLLYAGNFYAADQEILTSAGRSGTNWHEQKERWIRANISATIPFNYVRRGIDKAQFARPDALLIDDKAGNCDAFREAGGHAILHTGWETTSLELWDLHRRGLIERKVWHEDGGLRAAETAGA